LPGLLPPPPPQKKTTKKGQEKNEREREDGQTDKASPVCPSLVSWGRRGGEVIKDSKHNVKNRKRKKEAFGFDCIL